MVLKDNPAPSVDIPYFPSSFPPAITSYLDTRELSIPQYTQFFVLTGFNQELSTYRCLPWMLLKVSGESGLQAA